MRKEITPIFAGKKVVLMEMIETKRAVTSFGGLAVFAELLVKIGHREVVTENMPVVLKSPNAIPLPETFTAFLISVGAGARRFAQSGLLRADKALHAILGNKSISNRRHDKESVQAVHNWGCVPILHANMGVADKAAA